MFNLQEARRYVYGAQQHTLLVFQLADIQSNAGGMFHTASSRQ